MNSLQLKISDSNNRRFAFEFALQQLAQDPTIQPIMYYGGGKLTPEEVVENQRRNALYEVRRAAIIKEHDMVDNALDELSQERVRLETLLAKVMARIKLITTT